LGKGIDERLPPKKNRHPGEMAIAVGDAQLVEREWRVLPLHPENVSATNHCCVDGPCQKLTGFQKPPSDGF
jgi:hypothetical protein